MGIKWGGSGKDMLYGKQFPGPELQALWDMVDLKATIFWCGFPAPGYFLLRVYKADDLTTLDQDEVRVEDAARYEVWVEKIQGLISRNFGHIVSTHNADAMRDPFHPSDLTTIRTKLTRAQRRKNKNKT